MAIDGKAVTAIAVGMLFVRSGFKGWSILGVTQELVLGRAPDPTIDYPLTGGTQVLGDAPSNQIIGAAPNSIAAIALEYVGHAYRFGGAPGVDASQPWDCSSFVNYVVGVRFGRSIPGNAPGKYTGRTHGPNTAIWAIWPGLAHIKRNEVQAGDIIIWVGHMGIAISNTQMISALNPNDRTRIGSIDGFSSRAAIYGRLK